MRRLKRWDVAGIRVSLLAVTGVAGRLAGRAGVLADRDFRMFYLGFLTSLVGTQMTPVAISFAVLGGHAGAGGVSAVLAAESAPMVALLLALRLPVLPVAAAGLATGVGLGVFGPLWDTTMQREIPPALLARVSAYDWFGSVAFLPLGFAMVAPLSAALGRTGLLTLAAVSWLALTGAVLAVPSVRRLTDPGGHTVVRATGQPGPAEPRC